MYRIIDTDYGADADGNLGITATFYELDDEDSPEIEFQIIEFIQSTGELPEDPFVVHLIDPVTEEDVDFEIDPFEYISEAKGKFYLKGD